ncbi:MAG: hypothetical protein ACLTKI_02865 [Lachnospiraceae bacterium]
MGNQCIFCRTQLGVLQRKKLHCGGTVQTVCGECYDRYKDYLPKERAELALSSSLAEDREELQEYLDNLTQAQEKEQEQKTKEDQKRKTDQTCLKCGGSMLSYGPIQLKLGEETFFYSDLNRLMSGSLAVRVLRCQDCGYSEFYIPGEEELIEAEDAEE